MKDETEEFRKAKVAEINNSEVTAEKTWTTDQLTEEFEVLGFMAPFVIVRNRVTKLKGTLEFKHSPRIYFNWRPE